MWEQDNSQPESRQRAGGQAYKMSRKVNLDLCFPGSNNPKQRAQDNGSELSGHYQQDSRAYSRPNQICHRLLLAEGITQFTLGKTL